jgi:hypothetical protein
LRKHGEWFADDRLQQMSIFYFLEEITATHPLLGSNILAQTVCWVAQCAAPAEALRENPAAT